MARSAVDLGRFAAAEVHMPAQRGRAISNVVLGSTVGAVLGPLLLVPRGGSRSMPDFPNWRALMASDLPSSSWRPY